jgi:lipoyl(octanoyl) transferase
VPLAVHLLGLLDFDSAWRLQQRLAFESSDRNAPQAWLLVAEHPPLVTIGRDGSWADVRMTSEELDSRRLEVRWVGRGGGTILHAPGQLAVYTILPLEWLGLRVGPYLDALYDGLASAAMEHGALVEDDSRRRSIRGRTGLLGMIAAAVRGGVSYFGAYLNVAPAMDAVRRVMSDPAQPAPMSSLAVERQGAVRMTAVRESVVRHVSAALGFERYHWNTGHPLLLPSSPARSPRAARAG